MIIVLSVRQCKKTTISLTVTCSINLICFSRYLNIYLRKCTHFLLYMTSACSLMTLWVST